MARVSAIPLRRSETRFQPGIGCGPKATLKTPLWSGFTAWGVKLAGQAALTLIGRARGRRFVALAGQGRIVLDSDPQAVGEEPSRLVRKASQPEEVAGGEDG